MIQALGGFIVGALMIRMGFGGIVYYFIRRSPADPMLIIKAPTLGF